MYRFILCCGHIINRQVKMSPTVLFPKSKYLINKPPSLLFDETVSCLWQPVCQLFNLYNVQLHLNLVGSKIQAWRLDYVMLNKNVGTKTFISVFVAPARGFFDKKNYNNRARIACDLARARNLRQRKSWLTSLAKIKRGKLKQPVTSGYWSWKVLWTADISVDSLLFIFKTRSSKWRNIRKQKLKFGLNRWNT